MIYLDLFLGFLRVGCFAFGGAYGAIPLIRDVVLSYGWLSDETLTYIIAVSESTPGPIMVNLATYVGSSQAGMLGSVIATLAVILPSFIVTLVVMAILQNVLKNKYVQAVLNGLKPCIIGIIIATGLYIIISNCILNTAGTPISIQAIIVMVVLMAASLLSKYVFKKKISPILLIAVAALTGIIVYA